MLKCFGQFFNQFNLCIGGDQRGDRPRGDADRDNYRRDGGDKGGAGSDFKPEFVSFSYKF